MASRNDPSIPASPFNSLTSGTRGITVQRCTANEELHRLRGRWNRLLSLAARPSLYLTHDWMSGWHGERR